MNCAAEKIAIKPLAKPSRKHARPVSDSGDKMTRLIAKSII
jgi:hypothetical protein